MSELAVLRQNGLGAGFTATALRLAPAMAYDDWMELGRTLGVLAGNVQWWVGDWLVFGERAYGEMYSQALEETDYEYPSLRDVKYVASRVPMSLRNDKLTWTHHKVVAPLALEDQARFLDRAQSSKLTTRELREEVAAYRRSRQHDEVEAPDLSGRYGLILADPPWRYEYSLSKSRDIENQYPTMSLEEITALPVASVAQEDAVLYLWATSPKLEEALSVMQAWGFVYRTSMVWVKDRIGMGYWARGRHEFLLIGALGSPAPPPPSLRPDSVISAPRRAHSKKPDIYDMLETLYPSTTKIELFSRSDRAGWAAWGYRI